MIRNKILKNQAKWIGEFKLWIFPSFGKINLGDPNRTCKKNTLRRTVEMIRNLGK